MRPQQTSAASDLAGYTVSSGIATLGSGAAGVFLGLEQLLHRQAKEDGAGYLVLPALLPVERMESFDFFRNFPHLGFFASPLRDDDTAEAYTRRAGIPPELPAEDLGPSDSVLSTAGCFGVYHYLSGRELSEPATFTFTARCARHETHYNDLRRLRVFNMREIVHVGTQDGCVDHLERWVRRIKALLGAVGLAFEIESATDPFFDPRGSRATMQRLSPLKREFVVDDSLAIASVNLHRNFFGERCEISLEGMEGPVFTSCVAFGLERWVWALAIKHDSDWIRIEEVIAAAGQRTV